MKALDSGKIIVTGAAGMIGSALIYELNRRGYDSILAVDILGEDDRFQNLVPLSFDDYQEADDFFQKLDTKSGLFSDISCIFHLGACSSTTEKNASYLIKNNYECTKKLAEWAHAHQVRLVYASSAATYGDGQHGMEDIEGINEALRPLNMYGYSKHLFDKYAARKGIHGIGMKYFNVFGPNEYHKGDMRSMVLKAYKSIFAKGSVDLFKSDRPEYKNGEQKRDFLYVKDAVDMTIFLASVPQEVNGHSVDGVYNLGSGVASTWIELVRPIFEAMEIEEDINFIDMPTTLKGKYQYHTCADITKLRNIGYEGTITPLRTAVKDYVKNYLMKGMRHLDPVEN